MFGISIEVKIYICANNAEVSRFRLKKYLWWKEERIV
jgi:hypothetical protein